MSLILDALKRAERERRAGQTPTPLDAVAAPLPETTNSSTRRWLLPALVGAVVAGGAVYLWVTLHAHAPPAAPATLVTPAVVPAAPAPTPPVAATADPAPTTRGSVADDAVPASASAAGTDGNGPATLDDLVDDKPAAAGQAGRSPPKDASADTGDAAGRPQDSHRQPQPVEAASSRPREELPPFEQPVGPPSPEVPPPTPAPTPTPSLPVTPPAVQAPAQDPITAAQASGASPAARSFREMSPNYRAEFPALSIDVHVYDAEPQRRFVILNGKRYHEGETITEGPRIVSIVADGIVFDYRGERVQYGLTR